ncbi:MAG TPA: CocE/NonD family hydrolase [Anaerolineaceae bacterium]|nr:CocE/NonD family hydrolase [Anaerolineaceae bacterium]
MISQFGKYQGYSAKVYDGYRRTSDYLTLSDGARLAYDLYLPTKKGVPAGEPLPVLFKYTPYDRAWTVFDPDGNNNLARLVDLPWYYNPLLKLKARFTPNHNVILDHVWRTKWLGDMLYAGYAAVVVERPGTGASFGQLKFTPELGARESDEILNWIAAQKWSNGSIGMFGDSIQAQIQFVAASTGNPHLKAILPATTWVDAYSAMMFPGGIQDTAFDNFYIRANQAFDSLATPVDQDRDGALLAQARAERKNATLADTVKNVGKAPFRDFLTSGGQRYYEENYMLSPLFEKINRAGVPFYLIDGWYDICDRDDFLIYANLKTPRRLLVRPVDHSEIESQGPDVDYGAEVHRWFDYWLKGIDNGIMDEAPIHYYVQGADQSAVWKAAAEWPPEDQELSRYYLASGNLDRSISVNNGALTQIAPDGVQKAAALVDAYTVDYSTTTGNKPRWSAPADPHQYPNLRANDSKALTYTTAPLDASITIAGSPIAHLWLSTAAPDLDVFAYIEEVDPQGNSVYVTEGNLRASHRALSPAPFDALGLPWHNYYQSELRPIPAGEPVELVFDLLPTAWQFAPGKRVRVTITFADAGNFATPVLDPAPSLRLLRDPEHPSFLDLPVVNHP